MQSPTSTRRYADVIHTRCKPLLLSAAIACAMFSTGWVQAEDAAAVASQTQTYDIPAQSLDTALVAWSQISGVQLFADATLTRGLSSAALSGQYSSQEALRLLLAGTGLVGDFTAPDRVMLDKAAQQGSALELDTTSVAGLRDPATEGTGSYTLTGASGTATRLPMTAKETPQSLTVVTRQQIDDTAVTSMGELLSYVPGIAGVSYNSENTDYFVRGFALNNISVDGYTDRANGDFGGEEQQALDTVQFDRVEVIKGAAGLLKGEGNPSASVNAIRKRPTRNFQGYATLQGGSYDFYRLEADVGGPLNDDGSIRGRIAAADQQNHTFQDNYAKKRQSVYGVLDWDLMPSTTLSLTADYQKSETDSPLFWSSLPAFYSDGTRLKRSRSFSTAPRWARHDIEQYNVGAELEHRFDNGWTAQLQYRHHGAESVGIYGTPSGVNAQTQNITGAGSINTQPTTRSNDWELHANGPFTLFGREHELSIGATYYRDNVETTQYRSTYGNVTGISVDDLYYLPEPTWNLSNPSHREYRSSSSYLASRWNIADPLKLILGARLDAIKQNNVVSAYWGNQTTKYSDSDILIPYAGLVYEITPEISTYVSYTEIFRPQANMFDASDSPLEPRTGDNIEAGVKMAFFDERLNTSLAVYKVRERNVANETEEISPVTGGNVYTLIGGVETQGVELEVSGEVLPGWQVSGGYTYNHIETSTGEKSQPWVPNKTFKLFTSYRLPGAWNRLTVGGGVRWQGSIYYGEGATRLEQDSYELVDLMARYQISNNLTASLNVRNVFDKHYIIPQWGRIAYGEPTNMVATLNYKF
ncbi:TonB-dependent siderophore receptor [Pseudomonas sp. LRF_L74]|uniref:TonB-dependent siderophore receptor n=1 Tax=Pseudomonas sp. LRF_L74 TaxID=3369422 RepID=UPI003F619642